MDFDKLHKIIQYCLFLFEVNLYGLYHDSFVFIQFYTVTHLYRKINNVFYIIIKTYS